VFGGFVVDRRMVAPGSSFARLTPAPIRRVQQPAVAAGLIGPDLPAVRQALRTRDDGELLRRLQGDRFAGHVLSLLYPQVSVVLGRFFADGGLQRGASYEYRVVFTDHRGAETDRQFTGRVQVVDRLPAAPGAVRATAGDGQVTLSWTYPRYAGNPNDLVIGFHVYRADASSGVAQRITSRPVVRDDATPPEYADTLARNGVSYRYQVRAVDLARRESTPSAVVSAVARDRTPPGIPRGVVTAPGDGVVDVSWQPSAETDVAGYQVERSTGLDQPFSRLTTTPTPPGRPVYTDRAVVGGTAYFYRVIAVDASGNASHPSNAIAALPVDHTPPAPPSGVTVRPMQRRLEIRWSASPAPDVRGYYVYRGDTPSRLVRLVEQPVVGTVFVDSGYGGAGLTPGGRYALTVSTVDRSYNESPPVAAEVLVPDDEPPGPPTGFTMRNVLGRYAEAGWSSSTSLDVQRYVLSRSAPGQAAMVIGEALAAQAWTMRDTTAVPGVTYVYRLVAVDSAGNRSVAAEDTLAFRDPTPPPAPRHVSAVVTSAGIEVSWERVVEEALAGYHVYRAPGPTGVFERLTQAPMAELRFLDSGGRPEHYYMIRAVDRSANESAPSPVVRGGER
jgi:fibronectin type 3 domain-containing protein